MEIIGLVMFLVSLFIGLAQIFFYGRPTILSICFFTFASCLLLTTILSNSVIEQLEKEEEEREKKKEEIKAEVIDEVKAILAEKNEQP